MAGERVSPADLSYMRRLARDLALLETDAEHDAVQQEAIRAWLDGLRRTDGNAPLRDDTEHRDEEGFHRRAVALGMVGPPPAGA